MRAFATSEDPIAQAMHTHKSFTVHNQTSMHKEWRSQAPKQIGHITSGQIANESAIPHHERPNSETLGVELREGRRPCAHRGHHKEARCRRRECWAEGASPRPSTQIRICVANRAGGHFAAARDPTTAAAPRARAARSPQRAGRRPRARSRGSRPARRTRWRPA